MIEEDILGKEEASTLISRVQVEKDEKVVAGFKWKDLFSDFRKNMSRNLDEARLNIFFFVLPG